MTGTMPPGRVTVSVGTPQNLAKSENQKIAIKDFCKWFEQPLVTREKFRVFKNASFSKRQQLKSSAGWFIRCGIEGGVRNRSSVMPAQMITYDLDDVPAKMVDDFQKGRMFEGIALVGHSTRSHTPESPRLRVVVFVKGSIAPDDYNRVSRIVGLLIDPKLEHIDPVSFRPAQMMYLPSVSDDMLKHYLYFKQGGELLDWEAEIEVWEKTHGDSQDVRNLPKAASEPTLRDVAEEAEDPLLKKGPVGDFCRAWSITELIEGKEDDDGNFIEGPLKDKYHIDDREHGCAARMTYLHGHSTNGAVVYDDKFVYSHHGTDPASDMLVNAYDLVRLHLYADKDDKIESDTPMKDRPSVKAMKDWMSDDPFYREQQTESRYGNIDDYLSDDDHDLSDLDEEDEEDDDDISADDLLGVPYSSLKVSQNAVTERRRQFRAKPKKGWLRDLNQNDDGTIKVTAPNCITIIANDPRLFRKIAFNQLRNEVVLLDDLKSTHPAIKSETCKDKVYGDRWIDRWSFFVDSMIQLEAGKKGGGYDVRFPENMIHKSVEMASQHNAFHPVKDFFDTTADGPIDVELLETFLIRHAGAEDNQYIRDVTRNIAIASVMRIEEPGCKFDFAPILEGVQGTGKSTLIRVLYHTEFFGELSTDVSNPQRVAENIMGKWVLELPELSSLHKSDINDMKGFITKQRDDVRLAYGRSVADLPRQCVFWGTTNDREYLRDPTGNRRYWPVPCDGRFIDPLAIIAERNTFWRTAVHLYREMREAEPMGDLNLSLQGESLDYARAIQSERRKEETSDIWASRILDWADEAVPIEQLIREMTGAHDELESKPWGLEPGTMVIRVAFTRDMAFIHALGNDRPFSSNNNDQLVWNKASTEITKNGWERNTDKNKRPSVRQMQKSWITREKATPEDRRNGFIIALGEDDEDDNLI